MCDGDARTALNGMDIAAKTCAQGHERVITKESISEALQKAHLLYDKTGMSRACP